MPKSKSLSDLLKLDQDHFSVSKIKEKYKIQINSSLKRFPQICILVKHLHESVVVYLPFLTDITNHQSFKNGIFPDELKLAEVILLFKKADSIYKINYRHVSLHLYISKVFERIILNQINKYI